MTRQSGAITPRSPIWKAIVIPKGTGRWVWGRGALHDRGESSARGNGRGLLIEKFADFGLNGEAEEFGFGEGRLKEGLCLDRLAESALDHRPVRSEHYE